MTDPGQLFCSFVSCVLNRCTGLRLASQFQSKGSDTAERVQFFVEQAGHHLWTKGRRLDIEDVSDFLSDYMSVELDLQMPDSDLDAMASKMVNAYAHAKKGRVEVLQELLKKEESIPLTNLNDSHVNLAEPEEVEGEESEDDDEEDFSSEEEEESEGEEEVSEKDDDEVPVLVDPSTESTSTVTDSNNAMEVDERIS